MAFATTLRHQVIDPFRENESLLMVCVATVMIMLGQGVISPVLPLYAKDFGVGATMVGATISVFGLARMLLNLIVPDLATGHERLLAAGVECLREPAREEWGGLITTFLDPDGNYVQLVQMPSEGSAALAEDAEQYSAP